jgi:hypothetical protein
MLRGVQNTYMHTLAELNDPDRVKPKGRPALPTSLKPLVEEIRKKMIREEKKKARKRNPLSKFISGMKNY